MLSAAIDLGTAILSFAVYDSTSRIARADMRNPLRAQAGADAGGAGLRDTLSGALSKRMRNAVHAARGRYSDIVTWCFAGCNRMAVIAAGEDLRVLESDSAHAPWKGVLCKRADILGYATANVANAFFMTPLSGSAGGDVSSALLAAEFAGRVRPPFLLLDGGINADIAYCAADGTIWTASVPAGAVFEADGTGCGIALFRGAIDGALAGAAGALRCHIAGDPKGTFATPWDGKWRNNRNKARGISASGLLDAVAESVRAGSIRPDGEVASGSIPLCDGLVLEQCDISAYLDAKARVCAAVETVLARAGARGDWGAFPFLLSGTASRWLSPDNAESIGLWPAGAAPKALGNAAISGMERFLRARGAAEERLAEMAARTISIDLATEPEFDSLAARRRRFEMVSGI